ncbi:hypothetical protein VHEMI04099 [[Torrubiella] hemipterigena]|uniref:Calcineurin-like phosphoesterase domain-containing protein n=1 Tax=[Torrubiella] hemipterigena TaxID=1531966 RepID=A0A0A1T0E6_9HYPO|nr:hypothetical protein VHEMI04099 [[Torrubiella] hemipterigena]
MDRERRFTFCILLAAALFILTTTFLYITHNDVTALASQRVDTAYLERPTLIYALPKELIPDTDNDRRLIILGDIHGMAKPLNRLLAKTKYNAATDHVISAGDMINKGPDSGAVVDTLMRLNASAVRGNHEDNVLSALAAHRRGRKAPKKFLKTGKKLSKKQVEWIAQLPVILSMEELAMYVVHAGMVPGVRPAMQDPWAVMNMRTLLYSKEELRSRSEDEDPVPESDDYEREIEDDQDVEIDDDETRTQLDFYNDRSEAPIPSDTRDGKQWAPVWNRRQDQQRKSTRRTIVYGHDAKRGLRQGKHTYGLDSACVYGGKLTALVLQGSKKGYKGKLVQVQC